MKSILCFILFPFLIFTSCNPKNQTRTVKTEPNASIPKKIIIVPSGINQFAIIYGCACGQDISDSIKNGELKLIIPNTGLLLIKNEYKNQVINHEIYQQDSSGKLTLLEKISPYPPKVIERKVGSVLVSSAWNAKSICAPDIDEFYEHRYIVYSLKDVNNDTIEDYIKRNLTIKD